MNSSSLALSDFLDTKKEFKVYELNVEKLKILKILFCCKPDLKNIRPTKDLLEMSEVHESSSDIPSFFKGMTMKKEFIEGKVIYETDLYKFLHWFCGNCLQKQDIEYSLSSLNPHIDFSFLEDGVLIKETISIKEDWNFPAFPFVSKICELFLKEESENILIHSTRETFFNFFYRKRIIYLEIDEERFYSLIETNYLELNKQNEEKLVIYNVISLLTLNWFSEKNEQTSLFLPSSVMLAKTDKRVLLKHATIQNLILYQSIKLISDLVEDNKALHAKTSLPPIGMKFEPSSNKKDGLLSISYANFAWIFAVFYSATKVFDWILSLF